MKKQRLPRSAKKQAKAYAVRNFLDPKRISELRLFEGRNIFRTLDGKDVDRWQILDLWRLMTYQKAIRSATKTIDMLSSTFLEFGIKAAEIGVTMTEAQSMIKQLTPT